MYYYDSKFTSDLDAEDLILDYLMYRKTNGVPRRYRIKEQYEIGKGWPHYKDVLPYTSMEVEIQDNSADYFDYEHEVYEQQSPTGPPRYEPKYMHDKGKPPHGHHNEIPPYGPGHGRHNEHGALKDLYCDHCRRILPHIDEVLARYDYDGSPIYAPIISRILLDEIIEKIMIASRINDKNLIEALLLPEIFHAKRHAKYRK